MNVNAPIGVFDSGIGGMTITRELIRQLPDERLVYFGDTARVPYGSKSRETVIAYTKQILHFMETKEVKAIVVACNTISAYALEAVRDSVNVPIIGVVKPGARVAANATKNKRIGVIGTEGTVRSGLYEKFIHEIDPDIQVFQKACPLFVPLVEEGWWHDSVTTEVVQRYLAEIREKEIDTLIMGCTHYPLLRSTIREVIGSKVNLVNPAYETAVEIRRILEWKDLLCSPGGDPAGEKYEFCVSDDPERFRSFAASVLKFDIAGAHAVNIEEF